MKKFPLLVITTVAIFSSANTHKFDSPAVALPTKVKSPPSLSVGESPKPADPEVSGPSSATTEAKSMQKCREYSKAIYTYVNEEKIQYCPRFQEPLITGGQNSDPYEFPHMALIGYGPDKSNISWRCGGSLISDRFVLTAAHCSDSKGDVGPARWVRLGEHNVRSTKDEEDGDAKPEDYEIVERINHPNYTGTGLAYNDIALYRLDRQVTFSEFVIPACLNVNETIAETHAIITGWGRLSHAGEVSDILQKAKIPITPIQECRSEWKPFIEYLYNGTEGIRDASQICAGNVTHGLDTCEGDSGGPLQVHLPDPDCAYSVLGVTSRGPICGGNVPALYTRVSHYVDWIEENVWP